MTSSSVPPRPSGVVPAGSQMAARRSKTRRACAKGPPAGFILRTFAIPMATARDLRDGAALRQRVRPEHKAYLAQVAERIAFAGPLTDRKSVV